MNGRRKQCCLAVLLAAVGLAACDDDGVAPIQVPDVAGLWSGQYAVTSCRLSGAIDEFFCDIVFLPGAGLPLDLDLSQQGDELNGLIAQGLRDGDVEGRVDEDGVIELEGVIGAADTIATTTILSWFSAVVVDTMLGSWTFRVEGAPGLDLGVATVGANLRLFAPHIETLLGCEVLGGLTVDGLLSGELENEDCHFFDGSFIDVYSLTGAEGDTVEITERSSDFDSFLLVYDETEELIAADDDSGGGATGFDAQLILEFEVDARVFVLANSLNAAESGEYELSATQLGGSGSVAAGPLRDEALRRGPLRVLRGDPSGAKARSKNVGTARSFRTRRSGR